MDEPKTIRDYMERGLDRRAAEQEVQLNAVFASVGKLILTDEGWVVPGRSIPRRSDDYSEDAEEEY